MKHGLAPLSARKLIVSAIVIAAAIMVLLLLGFHHHTAAADDTGCLICIVLLAPVLLSVVLLFRPRPERVCFRPVDDRPVCISEYRVPFRPLRAPPPTV